MTGSTSTSQCQCQQHWTCCPPSWGWVFFFQRICLAETTRCRGWLIFVDVYVHTHTIHVWYIYLHLVDFYGKCSEIYHTWIVWDIIWIIVDIGLMLSFWHILGDDLPPRQGVSCILFVCLFFGWLLSTITIHLFVWIRFSWDRDTPKFIHPS